MSTLPLDHRLARALPLTHACSRGPSTATLCLSRLPFVPDRWVHFKLTDVYFPDPGKILRELHGEDLLQGKVIDTSDGGSQQTAFVVVEVEGLAEPVVVSAERIKGIL
jgi:hypothetical protein